MLLKPKKPSGLFFNLKITNFLCGFTSNLQRAAARKKRNFWVLSKCCSRKLCKISIGTISCQKTQTTWENLLQWKCCTLFFFRETLVTSLTDLWCFVSQYQQKINLSSFLFECLEIDDNLVFKSKDTCWIGFWLDNQQFSLWRQEQRDRCCREKLRNFEFQHNLAR